MNNTAATPIEMTKVTTTEEQILVVSDHCNTLWINEKPVSHYLPTVKASALIAKLRNIYQGNIKIAKSKGIKIGYTRGTKQRISALEGTLRLAIQEAEALYESLRSGWEAKMKTGIYTGYCDDETIKELGELKGKYMSMFFHSAPIGVAIDLLNDLNNDRAALLKNSSIESIRF